jgi:predicted RecA/RadA family phage recombinase
MGTGMAVVVGRIGVGAVVRVGYGVRVDAADARMMVIVAIRSMVGVLTGSSIPQAESRSAAMQNSEKMRATVFMIPPKRYPD